MAKVIILDTRETDDRFILYLYESAKARGYEIQVAPLPFGDIQYGDVIIERKEINDFISSITSDRMFTQVANMKANPDYSSIIIISGTEKDIWKDNLKQIPHIGSAMKQLTAWGVPVLTVQNDIELVDKAFELFSYARPIDIPVKRVDKDKKLSIWMSLPYMGYKNARKLAEEFGSIECLCLASEKEIQEVVGPKKGSEIFKALRE